MNDCIFCKIIKGEIPSKKIYEDEMLFGFLDINPHGDGHLLLIPKKHYSDIYDLDEDVFDHIHKVSLRLIKKLMNNLNKDGITITYNYGSEQQVKHFHLHLIPEYSKGCSMSVDEVYEKLK